jgi:hypothetical protein
MIKKVAVAIQVIKIASKACMRMPFIGIIQFLTWSCFSSAFLDILCFSVCILYIYWFVHHYPKVTMGNGSFRSRVETG